MPLPTSLSALSYGDSSVPSYLTATLASSYTTGQTFTLHSTASWLEVGSTGAATANPLGTTGPFVVAVDFGLSSEEHILCSSVNVASGALTVWTDGTYNGRGYGTPISAHAIGSSSATNCFPMQSSVFDLQNRTQIIATQTAVVTAQSTANTAVTDAATAQSTADAAGTLAASATVTADAALPKTGGTVTGATTFSAEVTILDGVNPQDPAAFHQIPTALPPSGAAGGSLAGTYPNPTIESSVALPGSPTTTTQAPGDNTTKVATTAFATAADAVVLGAAETYADRYAGSAQGTASRPLAATDASTTNARTPTAHAATHASAGSDPVTLAESQVTNLTSDLAAKAPLASPTFTGTPAAPTPSALDNSTKLATTAYTDAAVGVEAALLLAKASNLSDVASARTAITNLNIPVLYAAAYGVVGASSSAAAANTTYLNDLMKYAETLGGARIILPNGNQVGSPSGDIIYINAPLVFRTGVTLQGGGGTGAGQTTIRLVAASNCNVTQYQRYISTAAAWSSASVAYNVNYSNGATSFCTYGGKLYQCLVAHTSNATTPDVNPFYWGVISPVNQTTFNGVGSLVINTTPQNVAVVDGTQFGQFGGIMQFVVSGSTYTMIYTGVSGNTVQGVQLTSGTVTLATGNETIFPVDCSGTAKIDLCFHGGWPSAQSAGTFQAVDNYSSTNGVDLNVNVLVTAGTGDGWGNLTSVGGGGVGFGYSGQRGHIACSSLYNVGTGKLANADSLVVADVAGACGMGGHYVGVGSHSIGTSKSWNNGKLPLWEAQRTTSADVHTTSGSTNITSATAAFTSDDIGNFIYDDTSAAGASGTAFNAGTFIIDVLSATQATLNKGAKATATTATAHIGGSYIWPTATGSSNIITGAISPADGYLYIQKNASVTSNTDPSTDTSNWQQIRLAIEWGWSATEYKGVTENNIDLDCQADKFGSYNAVNSVSSTANLRSNGWVSNPWTWNGNAGKATTLFTAPAALSRPAGINLGSSVGHNIRVAFRQNVVNNIGTVLNGGTASRCIVLASTDGNYGTLSTSLPTNSSVIADGAFLTSIIATTTTQAAGDDSTNIATTAYADLYHAPSYPRRSGSWWPAANNTTAYTGPNAGASYTINRPIASPFVVNKAQSFTAVGMFVVVADVSGTARFAIYADNGSCAPGALVWEGGQENSLNLTSTALTQALSLGTFQTGYSATLNPGLYWIVWTPHTSITNLSVRGATTNGSIAAAQLGDIMGGSASYSGNGYTCVLGNTDITGTYPGTYGGTWASTYSCGQAGIQAT